MSRCHYDLYREGYRDVLAEARRLEERGLWTKEQRARRTKYEVSAYQALKHHFPRMDTSYWAGRVAAIKSAATADYPARPQAIGTTLVCLAFPDEGAIFCGSCGDSACWCCTEHGKTVRTLFRCDPCQQELVREHSCYRMPDGWDWESREEEPLPPLPRRAGHKLLVGEEAQPVSIFFPCTAIIALGLLNMALHIPIPAFLLQAVFVLHFVINGKH